MQEKCLVNSKLFLETAFDQKNEIKDVGLLSGNTGNAIIYFLLAKQYGNKALEEKGAQLMEWVFDFGISREDLGFANGLAGIGWSIEWLVQNELLMDTNTDEVLEPIDNLLYNSVSYAKDDNPSLLNGTLGKFAYFSSRVLNCNSGTTHRFKNIGHLECLVLLIDDLAIKMSEIMNSPILCSENHTLYEGDLSISLSNLGTLLTSISSIKISVNSPTFGVLLFDSIKHTESMLSNSEINSLAAQEKKENYLALLFLAVSFLIAAKNQNHKIWEFQATKHIERLVCIDEDNTTLDPKLLFQKLTIYSLLNVHFPTDHNRKTVQKLINALSMIELPVTLFNGLGALAIAEICLSDPGLVKNWNDLMFFNGTGSNLRNSN